MLKILPVPEIQALDAYTIEHRPIASIDLMERACRAFTKWFVEHFDNRHAISVVCGTGNNGGDGLGIARQLHDMGYAVAIYIVRSDGSPSLDFQTNYDRANKRRIKLTEIVDSEGPVNVGSSDVLIDAIFGSGLSRPAKGIHARVIEAINALNVPRVAVDIPSGLMADAASEEPIVQAHFTVTFQLPKLAFLLPENYPFVGKWTCVDIGLDKSFIKRTVSRYYLVRLKDARRWLKPRSKFDHKGNFGHALIIAGSIGKMGAAVLASRAALRSGVGLSTAHVPRCGNTILQMTVPEAMVSLDEHETLFSHMPDVTHFEAIGIGPGLGLSQETRRALRDVLTQYNRPLVLDADALNILAEDRELWHLVSPNSILTPHPGEFRRLVGPWSNDFQRLEKLRELSRSLNSIVVLKGAYTSIGSPDGLIYFNTTGNPGMATGGSGDTLTGIITGLLAQGYDPLRAALFGVFLHGLAGDLALPERGENGLIASDLIDFLPQAFQRLEKG